MLQACRSFCCLLSLGLVLWFCGLPAQALTLAIAGPSNAASASLKAELARALGPELVLQEQGAETAPDIWLALTVDAYRALKNPAQPVLVLAPDPDSVVLRRQDSALYWAPPLARQLQLTRLLLPGARRVGVLHGADSPALLRLREQAAREGIDLILRRGEPSRLARQVAELALQADVLLAPLDTTLYNRDTIKTILLSAYRQNRVLVGPGAPFVSAGALASLYASPQTLNTSLALMLQRFAREQRLPPPRYPPQFDVMLNAQVGRSLGLALPSESELAQRLRQEELEP